MQGRAGVAGRGAGDDASCLIVDPEVAMQQCRVTKR